MSYQLHCPNCSTMIPPENINIQQTVANCPNCAAVFDFANKIPSGQKKIKRRKAKKPDNMIQVEADNHLKLEMPYIHTTGYKISMVVLGLFMAGLYTLILGKVLGDNDPDKIVPMVFISVLFLPFVFGMIGSLFARQSIEVTADELKHEVRWGIPFYQRKIAVDDVVDVDIEEMTATRESVAEARYNIYAEKYDGRQDVFMQNQPEEMALYAQQALSNYFTADTDAERLIVQEGINDADDMVLQDDQQANQMQQM